MSYVQETIDVKSKKKLMYKILEFYGDRLMDLYKINAAKDYDFGQFSKKWPYGTKQGLQNYDAAVLQKN